MRGGWDEPNCAGGGGKTISWSGFFDDEVVDCDDLEGLDALDLDEDEQAEAVEDSPPPGQNELKVLALVLWLVLLE